MSAIRVLVVDDSVVARRLITHALSQHPEISVVGTAANGHIALPKIAQLKPDAVLLDVEMPEMNGIETLRVLRETDARLPVIMFSSLTERGAQVTLDALAAGASEYVLKPSAQAGESIEHVVATLIVPKLLAVTSQAKADKTAGARAARSLPERSLPDRSLPDRSLAAKAPLNTNALAKRARGGVVSTPNIVAIATSTGGPNALGEVLPLLPKDLPVPVVIVQHMPPIFTRHLAERLDTRSQVKIIESEGDEELVAGTVYLAPGDRHLEVVRRDGKVFTKLTSDPPENSCRPAADVLFRSVARAYGPAALGVVLTGMGQDGLLGAKVMVEAGARLIAQSGPTCVVWGMPKAVEEAGICSEIVPLADMATRIERIAAGSLVKSARSG